MSSFLTRRTFMVGTGGALLATACGADPVPVPDADAVSALVPADFAALGQCRLLAAAGAGPFPLDQQFAREDITDGYPGHPLRLGFRVVDRNCEPIAASSAEIWHCDSTGDYSAFTDNGGGKDEAEGSTFLRGTRSANADGIVEFHTIYPGWYPGRAIHIHLTVRVDGGPVLTSQLYFDDGYTAAVHADAPYSQFGPPDTATGVDFLAGDVVANGSLLSLSPAQTRSGAGTLGLINLAADA